MVPFRAPRNPSATPRGDSTLTARLRYEFADEEARPLLSSYAISLTLAAAWLLLVHFGPVTRLRPAPNTPPRFTDSGFVWFEPPAPPAVVTHAEAPNGTIAGRRYTTKGGVTTTMKGGADASGVDAAGAFGGPAVGIASNAASIIGNILLPAGGRALALGDGARGKTSLGGDDAGTTGPGRGALAATGSNAGSSLGTVGGAAAAGGVGRSATLIVPPIVVMAKRPPAPGRDVADVGGFVRAHSAQLQSCYEREGRSRNSSLAGSIAAAITIAGDGSVADVAITRRSWSGAGSAEVESCIRATVRAWRLPAASEAEGTYTFPMSFTAGR